MTVIAWDGKTLATDRMANDGSQKWESSKAWYGMSKDKEVVIITGVGLAHYIRQLSEWYQQGMPDIKPYVPPSQAKLIVVQKDGLYELSYKMLLPYDAPYCAFGDGKELALGALAMGATAGQAVNICNEHSLQCGKGVELFTLHGGNDEQKEC